MPSLPDPQPRGQAGAALPPGIGACRRLQWSTLRLSRGGRGGRSRRRGPARARRPSCWISRSWVLCARLSLPEHRLIVRAGAAGLLPGAGARRLMWRSAEHTAPGWRGKGPRRLSPFRAVKPSRWISRSGGLCARPGRTASCRVYLFRLETCWLLLRSCA